jgi:hypothetical protein
MNAEQILPQCTLTSINGEGCRPALGAVNLRRRIAIVWDLAIDTSAKI